MGQKPLDKFPDFEVWQKEFIAYNHLGNFQLAEHLTDKFGGRSGAWRTRVNALRRIAAGPPKQPRTLREQDEQFVTKVLNREFPYEPQPQSLAKKIDPDKTVCLADPHAPYHNTDVMEYVLANHHDAGHLHINGDLFDFYSKSRYIKAQGHADFYEEVRGGFEYLEWCAKHFKRVTVIKGNHDDRPKKAMLQMLRSDELWMVDFDIVRRCAELLPNVEVVGQRVGQNIPIDFIWQNGDVVFTHIERSLKQSSGILETVDTILSKWAHVIKLKPYHVFVQGHNHRVSFEKVGSHYGFLCPMAADLTKRGLGYVFQPTMRGEPPVMGCLVLKRENGRTMFNETRPYEVEMD